MFLPGVSCLLHLRSASRHSERCPRSIVFAVQVGTMPKPFASRRNVRWHVWMWFLARIGRPLARGAMTTVSRLQRLVEDHVSLGDAFAIAPTNTTSITGDGPAEKICWCLLVCRGSLHGCRIAGTLAADIFVLMRRFGECREVWTVQFFIVAHNSVSELSRDKW